MSLLLGGVMNIKDLAEKVDRYINPHWADGTPLPTGLPGLTVQRCKAATKPEVRMGTPSICLILQGKKQIEAAELTFENGPGDSQILSHALYQATEVTEASSKTPFLSLTLALDLSIMRGLYDQVGDTVFDRTDGTALAAQATEEVLSDALGRYFALTSRPWEVDVMGPLILKEIHYRLLMAPHGGMLRQLLIRDSLASRIARVTSRIRRDYRNPLNMGEMARVAGLSESAFYGHFKGITGTTPLQYQKDLRLLEARKLISTGAKPVTAAAQTVGYESATQFSREYARKFGASPRSYVGGVCVSA